MRLRLFTFQILVNCLLILPVISSVWLCEGGAVYFFQISGPISQSHPWKVQVDPPCSPRPRKLGSTVLPAQWKVENPPPLTPKVS